MASSVIGLMGARRGHYCFESGFHGDLWLDLDDLFARPRVLAAYIDQLADAVAATEADIACGPLTGGALVAYRVAERLGIGFCWSEREELPEASGLYHTATSCAETAPASEGCESRSSTT